MTNVFRIKGNARKKENPEKEIPDQGKKYSSGNLRRKALSGHQITARNRHAFHPDPTVAGVSGTIPGREPDDLLTALSKSLIIRKELQATLRGRVIIVVIKMMIIVVPNPGRDTTVVMSQRGTEVHRAVPGNPERRVRQAPTGVMTEETTAPDILKDLPKNSKSSDRG